MLSCFTLRYSRAQFFETCFGEDKFIYLTDPLNFSAAAADCVQRGATIARISNRAEFDFAREYMDESLFTWINVWIGSLSWNQLVIINLFLGHISEENEIPDGNDTTRFAFVDGASKEREFFEVPSVLPWESAQPNDLNEKDNCVA